MRMLSNRSIAWRYIKAFFVALAIIVAFLFIVWARAFYGSMESYEQGEKLYSQGEYLGAVTQFDRSLHWYTPFNPYIEKSAGTLWRTSEEAEKRGDVRLAVIAIRTLKRGFIAARSFYVPGKHWIERSDKRLQHLLNEPVDNTILDDPLVRGPDVWWSLVGLIGFLGWIGSGLAFIISRNNRSQEVSNLSFARIKWIMIYGFSWLLWIVGMMRA
jgi:hypothetical protein